LGLWIVEVVIYAEPAVDHLLGWNTPWRGFEEVSELSWAATVLRGTHATLELEVEEFGGLELGYRGRWRCLISPNEWRGLLTLHVGPVLDVVDAVVGIRLSVGVVDGLRE